MLIDPSALEAYREIMGDETDEFIADILDSFYTNAVDLLKGLTETLSKDEVKEFVRAAHTLKSTSATVGAQRLSAIAADLEARGETEPLSNLMPTLLELEKAYQKAEQKLKEIYP